MGSGRHSRLQLASLLVAMALSTPARAGGLALARFGGEAGHPTTDNPTALYYNPAGLALGTGTRLLAEGMFAYHSASYQRPAEAIDNLVDDDAGGTPSDAITANSGRAELAGTIAGPFIAVASDLGINNFGVGLGLYAAFGGSASWDANPEYADSEAYPGALDGVQRWAIIDGEMQGLYLSAGAAYEFPAVNLSVGATFDMIFMKFGLLRAQTTSGTDNMTSAGTVVEGRTMIEVDDTTVGASAGIIWQPLADLWLGLSYRSQPGFGENRLRGSLTTKIGTGASGKEDVYLIQTLPDVVRLGARYRLDRAELRLSADYTRWSVHDRQCVVPAPTAANPDPGNCELSPNGVALPGEIVITNVWRNYKDSYGINGGGSYQLSTAFELGGSIGFDSNSIPDQTLDAAVIDMNKLIFQIGASYALLANKLELSLHLAHFLFFDRQVAVRERDADGDPITYEIPSRTPDGAGTYQRAVTLMTLGVEGSF